MLCKRFDEAIILVTFAENDISTGNTLNIHRNVILRMGVFQTQYEEWYDLLKNERILINVLDW